MNSIQNEWYYRTGFKKQQFSGALVYMKHMHNWLWNSAEVKSPWKANGVVLLLGCFNDSGRVATHTGVGEHIFFSQEYRRHMMTKKIVMKNRVPTHKPGLTQLQLLQFTIKGATWSKLLSLALGKTSELTKVSFFLPLIPIWGESKQYHRQFEETKRVSGPVSLSQHDSPYWPWLCELLLST